MKSNMRSKERIEIMSDLLKDKNYKEMVERCSSAYDIIRSLAWYVDRLADENEIGGLKETADHLRKVAATARKITHAPYPHQRETDSPPADGGGRRE